MFQWFQFKKNTLIYSLIAHKDTCEEKLIIKENDGMETSLWTTAGLGALRDTLSVC